MSDILVRWRQEDERDGRDAYVKLDRVQTLGDEMADTIEALQAEVERLREDVIAFAGAHAAVWAEQHGLPLGHLASVHYDALKRAGADMSRFTRAAITDPAEPLPDQGSVTETDGR